MLTELMSRSVISSPPIVTAVNVAAAVGMPMIRSPSSLSPGVDVIMAQCNNPALATPGGLTRPMTLSGVSAVHVRQNSADSGLGLFQCFTSNGGVIVVPVVTRTVPNILFSPNSRLNSVFVFGRIVVHKIHQI